METRIEGKRSAEKESGESAANCTKEVLSDPARKLRILCLHGFRTSGKIMAQQIASANWAPLIDDIAELVYMDAPWPANKPFSRGEKFAGPYFEWYQSSKDYKDVYTLEETISLFSDYVTLHGPFDGLLGFSQGGILSAALMGFYEKGMGPKILKDVNFLIVVGGGTDLAKPFQTAYADTIRCPSLHLIGDKDFMKPFGEALAAIFKDPVVIRHTYGHLIPRLSASEGQTFRVFLLKQLQVESKFPQHHGNHPIKVTSLL